jgi:hypothetical protein
MSTATATKAGRTRLLEIVSCTVEFTEEPPRANAAAQDARDQEWLRLAMYFAGLTKSIKPSV